MGPFLFVAQPHSSGLGGGGSTSVRNEAGALRGHFQLV